VVTPGATNRHVPGHRRGAAADRRRSRQRTLDALRPTVRQLIAFVQLGLSAAGGGGGSPVPEWRQVDLANGVTGGSCPSAPRPASSTGWTATSSYIGTKPAAIREVQAPAAPLSADSAYKAAALKIPSSDALFIWANVQQILSFLDRLGVFRDDAELLQNLRPIQKRDHRCERGDGDHPGRLRHRSLSRIRGRGPGRLVPPPGGRPSERPVAMLAALRASQGTRSTSPGGVGPSLTGPSTPSKARQCP